MGSETFNLTCNQITGDDTTGAFHTFVILNQHNVQHLITSVQLHVTTLNFTAQCRISTQQQLLYINLNTINIEKYERQISKSDNTISRKFEDNNTRSIKDIYVSNLKADISAKLKEKGYEIDTSDVQIKDDENYTIEKITLKLIKMEQKQEKNNEIVINTVEIGNTISQKDSKTLSDDEKQEVKDYISETYDIDKKNINIS